jgi:hypothetical protein
MYHQTKTITLVVSNNNKQREIHVPPNKDNNIGSVKQQQAMRNIHVPPNKDNNIGSVKQQQAMRNIHVSLKKKKMIVLVPEGLYSPVAKYFGTCLEIRI